MVQKFELYLKELLTLPTSVFEEPSFGYNENLSKTCFDLVKFLFYFLRFLHNDMRKRSNFIKRIMNRLILDQKISEGKEEKF